MNLQKMKKADTWPGALRGKNTSVDPVTLEGMQKKIMLERFQAEVFVCLRCIVRLGRRLEFCAAHGINSNSTHRLRTSGPTANCTNKVHGCSVVFLWSFAAICLMRTVVLSRVVFQRRYYPYSRIFWRCVPFLFLFFILSLLAIAAMRCTCRPPSRAGVCTGRICQEHISTG